MSLRKSFPQLKLEPFWIPVELGSDLHRYLEQVHQERGHSLQPVQITTAGPKCSVILCSYLLSMK